MYAIENNNATRFECVPVVLMSVRNKDTFVNRDRDIVYLLFLMAAFKRTVSVGPVMTFTFPNNGSFIAIEIKFY